ncbi:MAG: cysteine desulfurase [Chlamydiales bacterium]|nr:cysteine desulfurase [Chlamydiales bacterium]
MKEKKLERTYLDNNATTALDARVLAAMQEELSTPPSNPSSVHHFGQEARKRLTKARSTVANFLETRPSNIIFTSGGTESLNMLLRGAFSGKNNGHLITSDIEHSAIYNTVKLLESHGVRVTYLSAGLKGYIAPEQIEAALQESTKLIALGAVNSETGVKNPIEEIAQIAKRRGLPFVVDGVALLGKELFKIPDGVSAMAFSGHKFHGPKGVGFAWIHSSFKLEPLLTGGDQEYAKRAGTENLPGIVGLAKAVEILSEELPSATLRMQELRDLLEASLKADFPGAVVHGEGSPRIANTSNIALPALDGETLLMQLDMAGIAVSHGSACASGALEPSRVLLNMGIPKKLAGSSLRLSLSRFTTREEILHILLTLKELALNS